MLFSAFAEVISLGAVVPFLGVLTAPERVYSYPGVAQIANYFGLNTAKQLVLPITFLFAFAAVMAGGLRIVLLRLSTGLSHKCGADLSTEIYRRTLYQPYSVHIARNSSEIVSSITSKVAVTVSLLNQLLILISSTVIIISIISILLVIDPQIAMLSTVLFGGAYTLISLFFRRKLKRNSYKIASGQTQVVKSLQEGLGGIRDVLLDGTQSIYCSKFDQASQQLRRAQGNNLFISGSPRFAMESLGMIFIAVLAYSLSRHSDGISTAIPILGALALGAQRLLPALQQAYNAWATIRGGQASLQETIDLLNQPVSIELLLPPPPTIHCDRYIQFKDVRFRYTSHGPWVLDGLNLTIRKGEKVAFVGSSGSGKSTALDLLMGLMVPTEGQFLIDGNLLSRNQLRGWQRSLAHVPQNIFLSDSSITQNIAFGVQPDEINMDRVYRASSEAQIAGFIEAQNQAYDTVVGERGVRLSGGQRQRIGIARALYKEADVLIFDEATSALDNSTEQAVMEAIQALDSSRTIILIAHRLTTVKACDVIFELKDGRIVAQGTYDELLRISSTFRQMSAMVAKDF